MLLNIPKGLLEGAASGIVRELPPIARRKQDEGSNVGFSSAGLHRQLRRPLGVILCFRLVVRS
jgi:hypothetical protein